MLSLSYGRMMHKQVTVAYFTTFKTALSKAERHHLNRHSEKNLKKEYLYHKGKSHSSTIWLDRQLRDPYYIRVLPSPYSPILVKRRRVSISSSLQIERN